MPGAGRSNRSTIAAVWTNDRQTGAKRARDNEHDPLTGRRPIGHADSDIGFVVEGDLTLVRSIGADDPQIAMAAVVGEIDDL